jgi:hypothetical protein
MISSPKNSSSFKKSARIWKFFENMQFNTKKNVLRTPREDWGQKASAAKGFIKVTDTLRKNLTSL